MNLIFHVASALAFAALIWYLLRLQAQIALLREIRRVRAGASSKVRVDWPDEFLKKLAEALDIPFSSGRERMPPCRLDLGIWAEASEGLGLEAIAWDFPKLRLTVRRSDDLESWQKRLEQSLNQKVTIEWIPFESK